MSFNHVMRPPPLSLSACAATSVDVVNNIFILLRLFALLAIISSGKTTTFRKLFAFIVLRQHNSASVHMRPCTHVGNHILEAHDFKLIHKMDVPESITCLSCLSWMMF